jgi:LuxR family quorum-sensing system transcriptional regulator SolR
MPNKNHTALTYCSDLEQLCEDLIKKLDLGMFCYHKVYKDFSEIMFSNQTRWAEYYYKENFLSANYLKNFLADKFQFFIWPSENKIITLDAVRNVCDVHQGISLFFSDGEILQIFGFATKKENPFALNMLVNSIDLLKNFCLSLIKNLEPMIARCNTQRIIPKIKPKLDLQIFHDKQNELGENSMRQIIKNFLFSPREIDCIKKLLIGKTMRETADELFISPRTVETHVENIKNKIGCNKKSELIATLFRNGVAEKMFSHMLVTSK